MPVLHNPTICPVKGCVLVGLRISSKLGLQQRSTSDGATEYEYVICQPMHLGFAGGLATLRSTELHALCVMTSRGMGGLTVSSPRSCTGRQHQHSSWLSESLQRGFVGAQRTFAGAAVQPVPQEEDVQLTANAVEVRLGTQAKYYQYLGNC
jgi:hypothetical protein